MVSYAETTDSQQTADGNRNSASKKFSETASQIRERVDKRGQSSFKMSSQS